MSRLSVEPKAPPVAARLPAGIVGTHALDVEDGVVLVGSDPHWTVSQPTSTATKAFVQLTARFAEEGSLRAVILAGDLPNWPNITPCPAGMGEEWLARRGAGDRQRAACRDQIRRRAQRAAAARQRQPLRPLRCALGGCGPRICWRPRLLAG
jgi:hypothetical protein